jgi:hypothetical protein
MLDRTQTRSGAKLDLRRRPTARIFAMMEDVIMVKFDHDPGSRSRALGTAYLELVGKFQCGPASVPVSGSGSDQRKSGSRGRLACA